MPYAYCESCHQEIEIPPTLDDVKNKRHECEGCGHAQSSFNPIEILVEFVIELQSGLEEAHSKINELEIKLNLK